MTDREPEDRRADRDPRFADEAGLRARFGAPPEHVLARQLDRLDHYCRHFIERSPFIVIGSVHPERGVDVSPRGDAPGFVQILDDRTLAIPERPGNNRLDTMSNILETPAVGLLFFIPEMRETLRVNGDAALSEDADLRQAAAVQGRQPKVLIIVRIREAFFHCGKAIIRSRLWSEDYRAQPGEFTSLDQIGRTDLLRDIGDRVEKNYRDDLY